MRANTMMIELYVAISQEGSFAINGINQINKNRSLKYDVIYETANVIRIFYQELQFKRGLGILDYIQAVRIHKKYRDLDKFKEHMLQSANHFLSTNDLEAIKQCTKATL